MQLHWCDDITSICYHCTGDITMWCFYLGAGPHLTPGRLPWVPPLAEGRDLATLVALHVTLYSKVKRIVGRKFLSCFFLWSPFSSWKTIATPSVKHHSMWWGLPQSVHSNGFVFKKEKETIVAFLKTANLLQITTFTFAGYIYHSNFSKTLLKMQQDRCCVPKASTSPCTSVL